MYIIMINYLYNSYTSYTNKIKEAFYSEKIDKVIILLIYCLLCHYYYFKN